MEQKKWNCMLYCIFLFNLLIHSGSTITYDTLVRAGVTCQSAFVHNDEFVSPVAAKGSRGIKIMPDVYFEPAASGPVRDF